MKPRLTPLYSYILGMWHASPSKKGIGVCGEASPVFAKTCFDEKIVETGKMLSDENCIFFYHSKMMKFFKLVLDERRERFRHVNDYSAAYVAGMYDSAGGMDENGIFIRGDDSDELVLNMLNLVPIRRGRKIYVKREKILIKLIRPWVRFRPLK